jgi:hypothetical protein
MAHIDIPAHNKIDESFAERLIAGHRSDRELNARLAD